MSARIPLHVLTGFLGSGKTTLLNRILSLPAWSDTAVLINEFGAIAIDHALVDRVDSTSDLDIIVLKGGCTCCALRGDLVKALQDLYARRAEGAIPPFARAVLETTGLADPVPVINTLIAHPALRHKFERGVVATTVDAVNGLTQLRRPEVKRQIALADRIIFTKTDLAGGTPRELPNAVRPINPVATMLDVQEALAPAMVFEPADMFASKDNRAYGAHKQSPNYGDTYGPDKSRSGNFLSQSFSSQRTPLVYEGSEDTILAETLSELRPDPEQSDNPPMVALEAEHSERIESVAFMLDDPVAWSPFSVWLTLLLHAHGEKILRFKALLNVADWPAPVAIDAVHHVVYPPRHVARWPKGHRLSRLVVIAQNLNLGQVEPSLRAFLARRGALEKVPA